MGWTQGVDIPPGHQTQLPCRRPQRNCATYFAARHSSVAPSLEPPLPTWRAAWAVLRSALIDELPPEALPSLKLAFNLHAAESASALFDALDCNGPSASANVTRLIAVLGNWRSAESILLRLVKDFRRFFPEPPTGVLPQPALVTPLPHPTGSTYVNLIGNFNHLNLNTGSGAITSTVTSLTHVAESLPKPVVNIEEDGSPFVGRDVSYVIKQVRQTQRNVLVFLSADVPGGSGKSTFARHVALALRNSFPRHCIEVNWRGICPTMEQIIQLLRPMIAQQNHDVRSQYRAVASELRASILLVDGLSAAEDARNVESLLPASSTPCCVLITSRSRLSSHDFQEIEVGVFSESTAVQLLSQILPQKRPDISSTLYPCIAHACANIPIALTVVARLLIRQRTRSAESVCGELEENPNRRLQATQLDTCFDVSYKALQPSEQCALRVLAVWSFPISAELYMDVFQRSAEVLHELEAVALLSFRSSAFCMHDTVRDFIYTKGDEEEKREIRRTILYRRCDTSLHFITSLEPMYWFASIFARQKLPQARCWQYCNSTMDVHFVELGSQKRHSRLSTRRKKAP